MLEQNVAGTVKTRNCTAELKDPHSSTLLENQEELQDDGTQIRDVCCEARGYKVLLRHGRAGIALQVIGSTS
jgi:hypothetical protein